MIAMNHPIAAARSSAYLSDDQRWEAVRTRDASSDGSFYYSVRTTGVYCKPSCASRPALRKNVQFHNSCADAEQAGFRACMRCKPDRGPSASANALAVERACREIESSATMPSLAELSVLTGLSTYHFHRVFKSATGVTPRAYAVARRAQRLREELSTSDSVTAGYLDSGFNSSGRFYADSAGLLGMKPTVYRDGGQHVVIRFAVGHCSLGEILVAATSIGVCAILLGDDPDVLVQDLHKRFPKAELIGADAGFERSVALVVGYVESPASGLELPLDVRGTAFQQRVWQALRQIPVGSTASYAEVAARLGSPQAVRAVAGACAANPIAVAIPCHRVVRSDGGLSGYRWGVDRKRALLLKESGR